jgi:hypothetical protein
MLRYAHIAPLVSTLFSRHTATNTIHVPSPPPTLAIIWDHIYGSSGEMKRRQLNLDAHGQLPLMAPSTKLAFCVVLYIVRFVSFCVLFACKFLP